MSSRNWQALLQSAPHHTTRRGCLLDDTGIKNCHQWSRTDLHLGTIPQSLSHIFAQYLKISIKERPTALGRKSHVFRNILLYLFLEGKGTHIYYQCLSQPPPTGREVWNFFLPKANRYGQLEMKAKRTVADVLNASNYKTLLSCMSITKHPKK